MYFQSGPLLLSLVISAPGHNMSRDAIRAGWGSYTHGRKDMDVVFMVGRSEDHDEDIAQEAETHGDLVQMDIEDTYENLSLKTISALQWAGL